ncbi:MAG: hypothetical protein ACRCX2_23195 [Paraclostridium sp.]
MFIVEYVKEVVTMEFFKDIMFYTVVVGVPAVLGNKAVNAIERKMEAKKRKSNIVSMNTYRK